MGLGIVCKAQIAARVKNSWVKLSYMEDRAWDWESGGVVSCFKLLALWPQPSRMISVPTFEPEPVIPTAPHTSQDCNEDQIHKCPGNCGTLSDGAIVMSGALSWVTPISLTQLQTLFGLCQGLSASPSGRSRPITFAGGSLFSGLSASLPTSGG